MRKSFIPDIIFLALSIAMLWLLPSKPPHAQTQHLIEIDWTPSRQPPGETVMWYRVYRGTQSGGPYQLVHQDDAVYNQVTDSPPWISGQLYCYVVTTGDQNHVESHYSAQSCVTIP